VPGTLPSKERRPSSPRHSNPATVTKDRNWDPFAKTCWGPPKGMPCSGPRLELEIRAGGMGMPMLPYLPTSEGQKRAAPFISWSRVVEAI
jgi:hypothetical protein